ncbi:invasin domain 3-containing protein, partial [Citrobacter freundii]|uniref:invasin domain 3-containing protein n=1 Tax=Citrobacter freundii TaxID=546 RepID=UPI00300CAE32
DETAYITGDNIGVTVTLKDAAGNPITGEASSLTSSTVTVPNATINGSWTDNSNGTYSATYVAGLAGTGLTATVKLAGWTNPKDAAATYDITASTTPAQSTSTIAVDQSAYTAGADMKVTVTLKDSGGNAVTGASSSLTADAVEVPNATLKSDSWTDGGDGTYTATWTATTAGTSLKAKVTLEGWSKAAESQAYAIAEISGISVNGHTFKGREEPAFPTTAFTGAFFNIEVTGADVSKLKWTSSDDNVQVDEGKVIFIGRPVRSSVSIEATLDGYRVVNYEFNIKRWFITPLSKQIELWPVAEDKCNKQGGILPALSSLGNTTTVGSWLGDWKSVLKIS